MKAPSKEALKQTMSAFIDDAPEVSFDVVDRSTLERMANCPAQGVLVASGKLNTSSREAESGEQVHRAYASMIDEYISAPGGTLSAGDLADYGAGCLNASRPDVQPNAIRGGRPSLWAFARFLVGISPANLLRFDGGEGERSGQLAWDVPHHAARLTSELDLLYAGPSPELLHEIDWKTGHKHWTAADVADSFQFQMHAWLVFNNYPDVQALSVQVWNTRFNSPTWRVEFKRRDFLAIESRIYSAVRAWREFKDKPLAKVPTWPDIDKCAMCDAAAVCPAAGSVAQDVASDPGAYVDAMVAIDAQLTAMRKAAAAHVDKTGADIVSSRGHAFGTQKPPGNRKPTKAVYSIKAKDEESEPCQS